MGAHGDRWHPVEVAWRVEGSAQGLRQGQEVGRLATLIACRTAMLHWSGVLQ